MSCAKTVNRDRDAVWVEESGGSKEACNRCDAHWRHLANTVEPYMCCGDAACCRITLTTCSSSVIRLHAIQTKCCSQCLVSARKVEISGLPSQTRHRASTSMYSLTFCVRVMSPERHHWKPAVQAAAVMLRTPPSPAGHKSATRAHPRTRVHVMLP